MYECLLLTVEKQHVTHVVFHWPGVGITLRHMRWNSTCGTYQELPPIDQNLQYDFNFQQFTMLPYSVTVLPVSSILGYMPL